MSRQYSEPVSCCRGVASLGGISVEDFSALDKLAVKLICLDSAFAAPLRQIRAHIGQRIAAEQGEELLSLYTAPSALLPACGLQGVIQSQCERPAADSALHQISGCAAVLGWEIPNLGRTVCSFDAGGFEGFLRGVTGEGALTVKETACLGCGNIACEFAIRSGRPAVAGGWKGSAVQIGAWPSFSGLTAKSFRLRSWPIAGQVPSWG